MGRLRRGGLALLVVSVVAIPGCKKKPGPGGPAATSAFRDPVVRRLTGAGFTVGKMEEAAADDYGADACVRGEVDRLDVLLCEYPTAEAAKDNQRKLVDFGRGAVNGATRTSNTTALVVADRNKVDLAGKRIKRLLAAFSAEPKGARSSRRSNASAAR